MKTKTAIRKHIILILLVLLLISLGACQQTPQAETQSKLLKHTDSDEEQNLISGRVEGYDENLLGLEQPEWKDISIKEI